MNLDQGDEGGLDRGEGHACDLERGLPLDLKVVLEFSWVGGETRTDIDVEGVRIGEDKLEVSIWLCACVILEDKGLSTVERSRLIESIYQDRDRLAAVSSSKTTLASALT